MNIAFMGTPDFAVPSLKKIIEKYGVKLVVTQPDKARGRGKKVSISPVKEVAVENNIDVIQPVKIRNDVEAIEKLKSLDLDFIIVVAFGQILSKEILDIPRYGCINLHGSLLPKYRGAAPIQWAVITGKKSKRRRVTQAHGLEIIKSTPKESLKNGSIIPVRETLSFGRKEDNSIVLNDEFVSGYHAKIYTKNNIFFIEDLGSTNGTFVNGTKIDGRVKLSVNDEVRLGNIVFKVID